MNRYYLVAALLPLAGCIGVATPDIITSPSVRNVAGAEALRTGAKFQLTTTTGGFFAAGGNDNWFLLTGLLADEFGSSDSFVQRNTEDQRQVAINDGDLDGSFRELQRPRYSAGQAIVALRAFNPTAKGEVAEMFFVQGYDETLLAEAMCNGVALSGVQNGVPVYGMSLTSDSLLGLASATFDSALANVDPADTASFPFRSAAQVGKARALVDRQQYAAAKATLTAFPVPSDFQYQIGFSLVSVTNGIWELTANEGRYTVSDHEGGNGLPFVSANDPRVPVDTLGIGFDSHTLSFAPHLYQQVSAITLVDGLEARLVAAEAELAAGNSVGWLDSLNSLRAGTGLAASDAARVAGLTPLADPGTPAARVDLMFSERAFWLFATGHRLGDLRRLIRQYGRAANTAFPTGPYPKGGTYGNDVNFPIPQSEQNNPNFHSCLNRDA